MFTFSGRLGRGRFAAGAGLRIGLFAASIVGFPWVLQGIVILSGCRSVSGACGAVGLVASTAFKPLATVLFIFSFLGIGIRRGRDSGATGWVGLLVPALLMGDYNALTVVGAPWSLGFTMGVLRVGFPVFACLALVAILILCLLPSREPGTDVFGRPGRVTADPHGIAPPTVPAVLLALTITAAAVAMGSGSDLLLAALLTGAVSILLPTFLLYLAPLWAATSLTKAPSWTAAACLLASAAPFLHWGYAGWVNERDRAREAAEIAAIPLARPATIPASLVFESSSSTGLRAAWAVPGIERVIAKGSYTGLMEFLRPAGRERRREPVRLDALPPEHLLLKVGRASALSTKGINYAAGPFELRLVSGTQDDLIGAWWKSHNPPPSPVPVLTSSGWFRGSNSVTTDRIAADIEAFLLRSLDLPRSAAGSPGRRPG